MNTQKILQELLRKYPGKTILQLPEKNPKEIICEIEPTNLHKDFSTAISIIDESAPHFHKKSTEVYTVLQGSLEIQVDDEIIHLNEGESVTICPLQKHAAKGNETWIMCKSLPGWTVEDHILV